MPRKNASRTNGHFMVLMLITDHLLAMRHRTSQTRACYEHMGPVWRRRMGAHRYVWSLLK